MSGMKLVELDINIDVIILYQKNIKSLEYFVKFLSLKLYELDFFTNQHFLDIYFEGLYERSFIIISLLQAPSQRIQQTHAYNAKRGCCKPFHF